MKRALLLAPVLLAGCAIPASKPAVAPLADATLGLTGAPVAGLDTQWWLALGDPQLDRIVADALTGNPTLDAAMARVRQAEATVGAERAANGPDLTLDANPQGQRLSGRYIIPPPYGGTTRFIGTVGANLSWNLDLFGRQKAAIEAARASAQAATLDATAARLMLAGTVVQTYLELYRAERQAAIARRTITTREGTVRLVQIRIRNQLASKLDAEAATTLLAQARQALVRADGTRALAANALAQLAGRGAGYAETIRPTALVLDSALPLPTRIPTDLLARRPDVAAAQARIAAAAAGRQVARRAFYPDVNLTALVGLQAVGIGNLFNLDAGTAGGGAAFHLPIVDSGRLKSGLASATAQLDLAIAHYNDDVLGAVREAADALTRIASRDAERIRSREVVKGYAETGRLNAIRVQSGLDSRLDLVDNDVRLLDAELSDANLATDSVIARVQLIQALGGGYTPSQDNPS